MGKRKEENDSRTRNSNWLSQKRNDRIIRSRIEKAKRKTW